MVGITRISAEPAFPSMWAATAGGRRPPFPALITSVSSVDTRSSAVTWEKGVENQ